MEKAEKKNAGEMNPAGLRAGTTKRGAFELRRLARSMLRSPDFEDQLRKMDVAPEKIISPLLSLLFETDGTIRSRAARAVGITVSKMAGRSPESARTIMRRLMWSLNDESGGIGWGSPEAMGEIMAESGLLAAEYYRILISYIDEEGNPLENEELERGALRGIGRLAERRPELVREFTGAIARQAQSPDPVKRALAGRILQLIGK